MPSAATREDTGKLVKSTGTPPAKVTSEEKQTEEKEETRYEEQSTIQTLVELPKKVLLQKLFSIRALTC